ncbi:glutamate-rich protein 2-like isoform X1 [Pomacea canaliculata]|uniref:glutamate-rich protein 2-like isoform X1 n=2 Tax=Pomacea canaliculata TaxID=400727 RepID=UPI000D72BE4F|nr:glutamate-rich protein 2-like isoform X1 [Pomacea canaliculata]
MSMLIWDLDQLPSEMSAKNKPLSKQTYEAARDEEKRGNDDISVKYPRPGSGHLKQSRALSSLSMEILVPAGGDLWPSSGPSSPQNRLDPRSKSNIGQAPPRADSIPRVGTPTKYITLTAVKRKQESETPFRPELDWREFTHSTQQAVDGANSKTQTISSARCRYTEDEKSAPDSNLQVDRMSTNPKMLTSLTSDSQSLNADNQFSTSKFCDESSDDGDVNNDVADNDREEKEMQKAPNELLLEFLQCLMKKDYVTAEKLCRMILIFEPDNPEALKFHPIILEKIKLGKNCDKINLVLELHLSMNCFRLF